MSTRRTKSVAASNGPPSRLFEYRSSRKRTFQPVCEALEDRLVPAFVLRLEEVGFPATTITDNLAGDADPAIGHIQFNGPYGNLALSMMTGLSKPILGGP